MSVLAEGPVEGSTSAARPRVHYTADRGWMNDPHGIVWHDGVYHLFYQCVPDSTVWSSQCSWGHAVSVDLVHWRARPLALEPGPDERGCWSGASVVSDSGELVLLYTRVHEPDLGRGEVVLARRGPDRERWAADPGVATVTVPAELDAHSFRDPCVLWFEDHWVMVVGAGLRDGRGALVNFVSPDLETWTCTGLAAARPSAESDPAWSGAMWECPQLFEVDGVWVLLVSVWADDTLYHVAAATGSYDGRTFEPRHWQQLTFGSSAYAMTSFADREGRRCVMSWLREAPDYDPEAVVRAGAHSLTYVLRVDGSGRVSLTPHPDVELLRRDTATPTGPPDRRALSATSSIDVEVDVGEQPAELVLSDQGRALLEVRLSEPARVVVDSDIVEICGPGGLTVHRLGPRGSAVQLEIADAADVRAWSLASAWEDE